VTVRDHDCCAPDHGHKDAATAETRGPNAAGPLVEILYFDGCPNHEPAIALVERVSRELAIEPEVRLVNVTDQEAARRLRFLGSPTIRVNGRDVDPNMEERDDYALSCRVFRTEAGIVGQPDERWVRQALIGKPKRTREEDDEARSSGWAQPPPRPKRTRSCNEQPRSASSQEPAV